MEHLIVLCNFSRTVHYACWITQYLNNSFYALQLLLYGRCKLPLWGVLVTIAIALFNFAFQCKNICISCITRHLNNSSCLLWSLPNFVQRRAFLYTCYTVKYLTPCYFSFKSMFHVRIDSRLNFKDEGFIVYKNIIEVKILSTPSGN